MSEARLVGMNHVAIEVGDIDAAVRWYERLFAFELRGRTDTKAFIDMGDQFLALAETPEAGRDTDRARHIGLVVDDRQAVERAIDADGVERLDTRGLDVRDPWGNRLQIVAYEDIQFTKTGHVLDGMGLGHLDKSDEAIAELAEKGMASDPSR